MLVSTLNVLAQSSSSSAATGIFAGLGILWLVVILALSAIWIWTMIDCLSSSLPTGEKVMWFFIILFTHLIGSIVYLLVARRPRGPRTLVT